MRRRGRKLIIRFLHLKHRGKGRVDHREVLDFTYDTAALMEEAIVRINTTIYADEAVWASADVAQRTFDMARAFALAVHEQMLVDVVHTQM